MGCGRGEYTTGLARVYPNRNFVGVDVKGDRLWVGSTQAIEENLANVAFLRAQIQRIESFFAPSGLLFPILLEEMAMPKEDLPHQDTLSTTNHYSPKTAKCSLKPTIHRFSIIRWKS